MATLVSSCLLCCLVVALGIPMTVHADNFCDNFYCNDNEYCCGYNQCCFNFGAIWYAWVIITVFVILCIVGCCCCCHKRRNPGTVIVQGPVVQPNNPRTVIVNTQQVTTSQHAASNYGATHPGYQYPQYAQQGQQKYMGAPPAYQPYQAPPGQAYQPAYQAPPSKDPSAPYYQ